MTIWKTYQSKVISQDIPRWHITADYNPNSFGIPVRIDSYDGQCTLQSQALFHKGNTPVYRFPQTVRNTWYADTFDWETEQSFQVQRFDAQFGQRYETEITSLPSYNESRLLYGR